MWLTKQCNFASGSLAHIWRVLIFTTQKSSCVRPHQMWGSCWEDMLHRLEPPDSNIRVLMHDCRGGRRRIRGVESSRLCSPSLPPVVPKTRAALWCRFQVGCVPLCHWATSSSSSSHKTINPSHNKPFSCEGRVEWRFHARAVMAIDPSHVICHDLCVIISLVLCDPLTVWNGCLCVLGDDLPLFLRDLAYATQVIQHAKPRGGLECASVCFCRSIASFFKD